MGILRTFKQGELRGRRAEVSTGIPTRPSERGAHLIWGPLAGRSNESSFKPPCFARRPPGAAPHVYFAAANVWPLRIVFCHHPATLVVSGSYIQSTL